MEGVRYIPTYNLQSAHMNSVNDDPHTSSSRFTAGQYLFAFVCAVGNAASSRL